MSKHKYGVERLKKKKDQEQSVDHGGKRKSAIVAMACKQLLWHVWQLWCDETEFVMICLLPYSSSPKTLLSILNSVKMKRNPQTLLTCALHRRQKTAHICTSATDFQAQNDSSNRRTQQCGKASIANIAKPEIWRGIHSQLPNYIALGQMRKS